MTTLRALLREDTAGDPMGRRGVWTGQRLRHIARALRRWGISVSPNTVRRLLGKLEYALHANRKSFSPVRCPQRDRQFRYLTRQRQAFARRGDPIISVDSKKKELIGRFKNNGRVWSQQATPVNDHDFRSLAQGVGIPRGLYDVQANRASVVVGTTHDTPVFAVEAICHWWREEGRARYPEATCLLILADSGGSNGARCRLWKLALQEKLVNPYELTVTVCHYPPGASKWNPIEHRVFGEISKNWAGQPLRDYPTMLRLIRETTTATGLKVRCILNNKDYPIGIKVSDSQMRQLNLKGHSVFPEWNYTLRPSNNRN